MQSLPQLFGNPLDGHHDDDLLSHQQRALEHLQFSEMAPYPMKLVDCSYADRLVNCT